MKRGKWIVGGVVGGLIGLAVWALLAYFAQVKAGWLALGVGVLVGLGVRLFALEGTDEPEDDNPFRRRIPRKKDQHKEEEEKKSRVYAREVTAGVMALVAAIVGKYLAVQVAAAGLSTVAVTPQFTEKDVVAGLASEVMRDWQSQGKRIAWPAGVTPEYAAEQKDFPSAVWQEATKRWEKLGAAEQESRLATLRKQWEDGEQTVRQHQRASARTSIFSPWDPLWFVLAAGAAVGLNWEPQTKEKERE
jgi:hypothetical protein